MPFWKREQTVVAPLVSATDATDAAGGSPSSAGSKRKREDAAAGDPPTISGTTNNEPLEDSRLRDDVTGRILHSGNGGPHGATHFVERGEAELGLTLSDSPTKHIRQRQSVLSAKTARQTQHYIPHKLRTDPLLPVLAQVKGLDTDGGEVDAFLEHLSNPNPYLTEHLRRTRQTLRIPVFSPVFKAALRPIPPSLLPALTFGDPTLPITDPPPEPGLVPSPYVLAQPEVTERKRVQQSTVARLSKPRAILVKARPDSGNNPEGGIHAGGEYRGSQQRRLKPKEKESVRLARLQNRWTIPTYTFLSATEREASTQPAAQRQGKSHPNSNKRRRRRNQGAGVEVAKPPMTQSATEGESPSSNHLPHLPEQVSIPPHRLSQSDRTSSSVSQPGKGERKLGSRKRSVARADHELENKENQGTSSSTNSHRDCESVASKNATSTKPPVVGPENKSVRVQLSDGPDLVTAASPERHTDRPLSSASAKSNANPAAPKNRGMTRKSPKKVTIQKTPADRHVGEGTEAQESNRAHPRHLPGTSTRASSAGKPGDDTSTKPANGRSTKPGGDHATKPTGSRSAKLALETPLPPTADVPTLNESGTQEAKPKAKSKATPRSQTKRASKGSSNQEKG